MTIAHIAGLPVEETLLLPLVSGATTGARLMRAGLASRIRTKDDHDAA